MFGGCHKIETSLLLVLLYLLFFQAFKLRRPLMWLSRERRGGCNNTLHVFAQLCKSSG